LQVSADRNMLETVVRNLVGNAIKFTPRGGTITLAAAPAEQPDRITLSVSDSGVGMAPAAAAKLFRIETHYSTPGTEQERGSGLGLVICKDMVDRSGGRIWVESQPGEGTTMSFTIPLAGEEGSALE
jgi:signal transduction histidine kinase